MFGEVLQATPDCPVELRKAVNVLMGLNLEGPVGSPVSQATQSQARIEQALREVGTAAEEWRTGTTAVDQQASNIAQAAESDCVLRQSQQLLDRCMASINASCQLSTPAYGGSDNQLIDSLTAPIMVQMAELQLEAAESRR